MACEVQRSVGVGFARAGLLFGTAVLSLSVPVWGQVSPGTGASSPQTVVDVLEGMSGRADVIFTGQVVAVRRPAFAAGVTQTGGTQTGVVEIDFRVDTAIRGCAGGLYTLREWAGLWGVESERYRMGERFLMLLHAPSAAGLSSPVDGLNGAIPIRQGGSATPFAGPMETTRFVDLRWLGAKLPREVSYRSESAADASEMLPPVPFVATPETLAAVASGSAAGVAGMAGLSAPRQASSIPTQQASVDAVLGMLTGWEKARHAVR
ncbi:MAG: hypothetical protein M3Y50_04635 [Acidobacteriota bacterium]|nr:hypothetical protein [Acidobacteriota bacterium]